MNDDEAYELAQSFWNEVSSNKKSENEAIFLFIEFLQLIKSHAKGFIFELAQAEDCPNYCGKGRARNSTDKELLGVVWMTATMRRNLELFGSFLCFDMMMRGINTLFWPYVGIALMDEFGKLCLGCEGIVFEETSEMYQFVVSFIMKHCPGLLMDDVRFVAADRFLNQKRLGGWGSKIQCLL